MKIQLRPMEEKDLAITFEWRNDELVRRFASAYTTISYAEHEALFKFARAYRYIFEVEGVPVGFLSLSGHDDSNETDTTWSFHLAPEARGKGYSEIMLAMGILEAKGLKFKKILSEVKTDNEASLWLHVKFKFIPKAENTDTSFLTLEKDLCE